MADLTIAGVLNANGSVEIRPVKANRLDGGRLVPPVAVPATPAFSVKVPDVPGIVYRVRAFNAAGRPGGQAFTSKSVSALALDVPPVVTGGGGGGGGGGPAYDDTALKARVATVESSKLDKSEAARVYASSESLSRLSGQVDGVREEAQQAKALATGANTAVEGTESQVQQMRSSLTTIETRVQQMQQDTSAYLKGLVLGLNDPVPPGTPSGYVIVRKSE